jgi:O-antigen ligase/tetratricopeptide (TPR) repeat protein
VAAPAVVCAAALVVPLAYLPNLRSVFAEPKLALLSVAGAAGLGLAMVDRTRGPSAAPRLGRALAWAVAAWLATTLLSGVVARVRGTPGAPYARVEIGRMLAVVGIALGTAQAVVAPLWRQRLLMAITGAAGVVSFIGLLQHLQLLPLAIPVISVPGSTFGNRNIAAEAIAMSIPFGLAAVSLARAAPSSRDGGGVAPILVCLILQMAYLGATRTRGAWLGASCGVAAFLVLRRRALPRRALIGVLALGVAGLAAAAIPGRVVPRDLADAKRFEPGQQVVREALDPASPVVRTRIGLWRRTLAMYAAHPIFGVGPGNFVVFFPLYAEPGAGKDGVMSSSVVPRRAHQDLLERLAETGPLGLAAWLAVYAVAGAVAIRRSRDRRISATSRPDADADADAGDRDLARSATSVPPAALVAGAAGSLAALFACGLSGFPLAMPATALLLAVALGCLACEGTRSPAARPAARSPRAAFLVAVLLAGSLLLYATVTAARGLARSYSAARALAALRPDATRSGPTVALAQLQRADRVDPGRFDVALETGFVLLRLGRGAEALAAFDRALAVEPHSPNAWALRGEADLATGDARRAAEDARHATTLLADYPEALATRAAAQARIGDLTGARQARALLAGMAAAGDANAQRLLAALLKTADR